MHRSVWFATLFLALLYLGLAFSPLSAAPLNWQWLPGKEPDVSKQKSKLAALPRSPADRPDQVFGPQIHVMYVLPADGVDEQLDTNGQIATSILAANLWLLDQTPGRWLRIDTYDGLPDITFVRLNKTNAELLAFDGYIVAHIESELRARNFIDDNKIYAVYYGGSSAYACAQAAWPPEVPGRVGAFYLKAAVPGYIPCYANPVGTSLETPQYWEFGALHELMHVEGIAPACALHFSPPPYTGHVGDHNNDLMYAGPLPWTFPPNLDIGRDDYYKAGINGCLDLTFSRMLSRPYPYFYGNAVAADYRFPDVNTTLYASGNAVADPGVEFPHLGASNIIVDFAEHYLTISYPTGWKFGNAPSTFDGLVIYGTSGSLNKFASARLMSTNIAGFDNSRVTSDASHVYINQKGFTSFAAGSYVVIEVRFGEVPTGCALSASPLTLPAGGGNVTLTASCSGGDPPNGYFWQAGFKPGKATAENFITFSITRTTTFYLNAFNDAGSSDGVWVEVAVAGTPPVEIGPGVIVNNPYGNLSAQNASINGDVISNFGPNATIQLGNVPGTAGSYAEIDLAGLNLSVGASLTISAGAAGQTVLLRDTSGDLSTIDGSLIAQASGLVPAPVLHVQNANGITIGSAGSIVAKHGLSLDTLGATLRSGKQIQNLGTVDGGTNLLLLGAAIDGGGRFAADDMVLSTFGNANNPVNGAHFLSNGLQLGPSTGNQLTLAINAYGDKPQFINTMINGDAVVSMPSSWGPASPLPPNNAPLALGATRPPGTPEPSFGGSSIIVQATGKLSLDGGVSNDFVFAGGVVLRAGKILDLAGVLVNQGWTTVGKAFQGIYFEAPIITTPALTTILSNDLNWTNFSSQPTGHFQISRLLSMQDGSAQYVRADAEAPHINTYSVLLEAAANGQCWICLINFTPINVQ